MFFHEYSIGEIFDLASLTGADALEFWLETPAFWLTGLPLEELRSAAEEHPELHPMLIHAPVIDLNPCSINPKVQEISLAYALEALRLASELGAELVTIHPGRRSVKRRPNAHDIQRFRRLLATLERGSMEFGVKVALENMEAEVNTFFSTPGEVRELLVREEWLLITLDIAHALYSDDHEAIAFIDSCGERLANVHLSGRVEGVPHLPHSLDPRTAPVLIELRKRGYDGAIILELEDQAFDRELSCEEKLLVLTSELEKAMRLLR